MVRSAADFRFSPNEYDDFVVGNESGRTLLPESPFIIIMHADEGACFERFPHLD